MSRGFINYLLEALLHVPNVNDVVEQELTSFGRDFNQMVVFSWWHQRRDAMKFTRASKGQ
jgi:hypothetical protein